jgi:hypothetical protein
MAHEGIWVHGAPAHDLGQVNGYLTGDAHDQSKVEWFDGETFWNLRDLVEDAKEKKALANSRMNIQRDSNPYYERDLSTYSAGQGIPAPEGGNIDT